MADAKKCLLDAAAKLFSRQGLEKTSTRDLAKESNSNISLISYHFGGKEGLYKEVVREFALEVQKNITGLIAEFEKKELTKESFVEQIGRMIDQMITMRKKNPEICTILAREKIEGLPLSKEIHDEIFFPLMQKFSLLFERAKKKNIVKQEIHPAVFLLLMNEGIFGFYESMACHLHVKDGFEQLAADPDFLKNQVLQIYLKGALA